VAAPVRWHEAQRLWYQEIADRQWVAECLTRGYERLCAAHGEPIRSARMGWEYHDNHTLALLADLGVAQDVTAAPGRAVRPSPAGLDRGVPFHMFMDWRGAPDQPYRPSRADYRRPAAAGEEALDLLEIPRTTAVPAHWRLSIAAWRLLAALAARDWTSLKDGTIWSGALHAVTITMNPAIVGQVIDRAFRQARGGTGPGLLVLSFHADELLPPAVQSAKKLLYDPGNWRRNWETILIAADRYGVTPRFCTASGLAAITCGGRQWSLQSGG